METDSEMEAAEAFYRRVANFAKDHGVVINVISIKGTTCSMEILGLLADITSGEVDIVGRFTRNVENHANIATRSFAAHNQLPFNPGHPCAGGACQS